MLAPRPLRHGRPSAPITISTSVLVKSAARPILPQRRSTLKRSIDESSSMELPSSPSKRSRVTFDNDVEIVSAGEDDDDAAPAVVQEQIRRAIQRHHTQDDESYERIRSLFSTSPDKENAPSGKTLKTHVQALMANVSLLSRECGGLVVAVLDSEWIGRDQGYYVLFVKFLGNLAAAQGGYLNKIMQNLIDLLGPQRTRRIASNKPVRQSRIHQRALQAIQYITQLIPTASGALADRVAAKLDFDFQVADERMTYIRNFMSLIRHVPELTSETLNNVLRQLIKLDTAVQADLDDDEDDVEEEILQHMSASQTLALQPGQDMLGLTRDTSDDSDIMSTSSSSGGEDEEDQDPAVIRRQKLKESVRQVDEIMEILFQYYSRLTTSTALQVRHNAIEQLIAQFHALILPTYRSRHPQFLIFHFAQSDPIIVDRFVTSCVATLIDKKQPQVIRHAAAAYFSGFVGRGAHVSPSVVQDCLDLLCDQLDHLRKFYEPTCRGPDIKKYGDFYSIFQAVMYIFCFRWRDIGAATSDSDNDSDIFESIGDDEKKAEEYHFSENLQSALHAAIYSPLNPLRVCTPAIVEQFAKITMILRFMYLYPKLEENKRVQVPVGGRYSDGLLGVTHAERDSSWVGDNGMLEGYFPFDPYHLPMSRHWIEADYVDWQGLPGDDDEGSDSDDDSNDATDDDGGDDIEIA